MNDRDFKKIKKIAEERGGSVREVENKLEQIIKEETETSTEELAGIPVGRTIVIKNNIIVWTRKKEVR